MHLRRFKVPTHAEERREHHLLHGIGPDPSDVLTIKVQAEGDAGVDHILSKLEVGVLLTAVRNYSSEFGDLLKFSPKTMVS